MSPEVRLELLRLLSALCDGGLTEVQHRRLEELLDADAECRRLYLEYADMHARLLVHPPGRGPARPRGRRIGGGASGRRTRPAACCRPGPCRRVGPRWRPAPSPGYLFSARSRAIACSSRSPSGWSGRSARTSRA